MTSELLSATMIAQELNISVKHAQRLMRKNIRTKKFGKQRRATREALNEFIASIKESNIGKETMSVDTKNKIKYHSTLKSQDILPGTVDKLNEVIAEVKEQVNHLNGFKKVAQMARLQHAVTLREELKTKLSTMDKTLDAIGSKAYPELMILKDMDADALEELFARDANNQSKRMVDYLDKEALENLKVDNKKEPQAMAVGQ